MAMEKTADAFRTISEVAEDLDLPQHVLRFWETRFTQIRPLKRGGGRRYYRREDIELLRAIRRLSTARAIRSRACRKFSKSRACGASSRPGKARPKWCRRRKSRSKSADAERCSPRRPDAMREEPEPDFAFGDTDEPFAGSVAGARASLGPADYKVLETLLAELNECERLLGNARRPPARHRKDRHPVVRARDFSFGRSL